VTQPILNPNGETLYCIIYPGNIFLSAPDRISKPIDGGVILSRFFGSDKKSHATSCSKGINYLVDSLKSFPLS